MLGLTPILFLLGIIGCYAALKLKKRKSWAKHYIIVTSLILTISVIGLVKSGNASAPSISRPVLIAIIFAMYNIFVIGYLLSHRLDRNEFEQSS
jgi:hypothetical protein